MAQMLLVWRFFPTVAACSVSTVMNHLYHQCLVRRLVTYVRLRHERVAHSHLMFMFLHSDRFYTMKTFQFLLVALLLACATAFAPATRPAFAKTASMAMSKLPEAEPVKANPNAAAIAAFATALVPLAAHATEVDEGTIIGYGAGLVACVVSLAVGFSIGYGTLVKP